MAAKLAETEILFYWFIFLNKKDHKQWDNIKLLEFFFSIQQVL